MPSLKKKVGIVLRFLPFREPLDELFSVYFDF